jgi:hypothetical protein
MKEKGTERKSMVVMDMKNMAKERVMGMRNMEDMATARGEVGVAVTDIKNAALAMEVMRSTKVMGNVEESQRDMATEKNTVIFFKPLLHMSFVLTNLLINYDMIF